MNYLLKNDFSGLKKKPLKILIIIIVIELLFQKLLLGENSIDIILGRNFIDLRNYISALFFLLNTLMYIYITLYIIISDITINLENIFLRVKPEKFMIEKIIFIIFTIFLFRCIEYIAILPLIVKFNLNIQMISIMIIKDVLYYTSIAVMSIFARQLCYRVNNIYIFIIIAFTALTPRNFDKWYFCYIMQIIVFSIINIIFIKMNSKSIIEKEGEYK